MSIKSVRYVHLWITASSLVVSCFGNLTIAAVQLHCVGRQLDGDALLAELWKLKVLHLPISAEDIDVQDWGVGGEGGRERERERERKGREREREGGGRERERERRERERERERESEHDEYIKCEII